MLFTALAKQINEQTATRKYNGITLAKYLNMDTKDPEVSQFGKEYFNYLTNDLMINNPDMEAYKSFYTDFTSHLSDSINLDEYNQTYFLSLGFYYYANMNYPKALKQLDLAYLSNPENIRTKQLISDVVIKHLITNTQNETTVDSMDYYFDVFPFIFNNDVFQSYYIYCLCYAIHTSFEVNQPKEGILQLDKLQTLLTDYPDMTFDEQYLEAAIIKIMAYYVHDLKYDNAIYFLERGLEILPHSAALNKRLKELETINRNKYTYAKPDKIPIYSYKTNKYNNIDISDDVLVGCWKMKSLIWDNQEIESNHYEKFSFVAQKSEAVDYSIGGKDYTGRWALRKKSRLMYLVPDRDYDNYLVFRIYQADTNQIILRPYENNKLIKLTIELQPCN
jgi:hypothetical protein